MKMILTLKISESASIVQLSQSVSQSDMKKYESKGDVHNFPVIMCRSDQKTSNINIINHVLKSLFVCVPMLIIYEWTIRMQIMSALYSQSNSNGEK